MLPFFFAAVAGFTHAFEVDHLLAVSSIVTRRRSISESLRDGIYWGLGHTSTILIVGLLMIVANVAVGEQTFHRFEALVGLVLIALGIQRVWQFRRHEAMHRHESLPSQKAPYLAAKPRSGSVFTFRRDAMAQHHHLAYGVGLIHGLAGSGALVLLVMTDIPDAFQGVLYLLLFGMGSIAGMLLASGVFSLPFSKKISVGSALRWALTLLSSALCVGFGIKILLEHLG